MLEQGEKVKDLPDSACDSGVVGKKLGFASNDFDGQETEVNIDVFLVSMIFRFG